ncbi:MAG: hypothetical protein V7K53_33965 [Nostoc sp.]|uniref:hypothetical protein n=1 Tax=Nostoc sp. TaxID=1180 RepID=UPI002FF7578E
MNSLDFLWWRSHKIPDNFCEVGDLCLLPDLERIKRSISTNIVYVMESQRVLTEIDINNLPILPFYPTILVGKLP